MKQYRTLLQNILGIMLIIAMLFSFGGCNTENPDEGKTHNGETAKPSETLNESIIMTINGYEISKSVYTIMLYNAAVELKMEAEPDQAMTDEEYEEWFLNFYNIAIHGKMPFEIVRENVIGDLKEYTYYMQALQAEGMHMSEADRNDIETYILITAGDEYDPEHPDEYFIYTYGVTKEEYIDYMVSIALIDSYMQEHAAKETVSQEAIDAYLDNYSSYYTVWSIQNIYLAASTEDEFTAKQTLGEQLAQRIRDGEDMTSLVKQYSEDGSGGDGIFYVSNDQWDYPDSILEWVYSAAVNDVGVVKAEDGIYVLKCVTMDLNTTATEEIQFVLGMEQLEERVRTTCEGSAYTPQLNEDVYNSFTQLPGDLMISDGAVG